ncbi:MAG TPA: phosphoadenosine phosphosulfate reductase family protein [Pseudonocardiaceae bacterium]|nr:phosphoadenosine phosphosulfate reductase family protein [Pseudonocardiaceae bacterium]
MAWNRYDEAVDVLCRGKRLVAVCQLVSGGNDSYTVAHIFRDVATHQVHANTGTGIEATREFVRATAAEWGLPLMEVHPKPGEGYWDLVRGTVMARSRKTGELVQCWPGGFPGPAAHSIMYQRLKERGLEQVPHLLGISGSRTDRALCIAGRRRSESKRRATVPHYQPHGTIPWASPIAVWHKADLLAYRLRHPGVPQNPVARRLGLSAECGCLANATAGEPERWRTEYPDDPFILAVNAMEAELAPRTDIPEHRKRWGWGGTYDDPDKVEPLNETLCSVNCGLDPLFDLMDPLFNLGVTS